MLTQQPSSLSLSHSGLWPPHTGVEEDRGGGCSGLSSLSISFLCYRPPLSSSYARPPLYLSLFLVVLRDQYISGKALSLSLSLPLTLSLSPSPSPSLPLSLSLFLSFCLFLSTTFSCRQVYSYSEPLLMKMINVGLVRFASISSLWLPPPPKIHLSVYSLWDGMLTAHFRGHIYWGWGEWALF